jgi:hypothetical protein
MAETVNGTTENAEDKSVEGTENQTENNSTNMETENEDNKLVENTENIPVKNQTNPSLNASKIALLIPLFTQYLKKDHIAYLRTIYIICLNNVSVIITLALINAYLSKIEQEEAIRNWVEGHEYTKEKRK